MQKNIRKLQHILDQYRSKFSVIETVIVCALLVFAGYICFVHLGRSFFENWDEAWYAEITKHMLRSKNFIIPYFNGSVNFDKPPLNFWLDSLWSLFFGLSEFSIRITSALSGFIIICIIVWYSFKRWGLVPALLAFFALALNNIFIWRTRTGNLDTLATLLIVLSYFIMISKLRWKYRLLGVVFGLLYLQKASLVLFPFVIFLSGEILFHLKELKRNIREYAILMAVWIGIGGVWLAWGSMMTSVQFLLYYLFRSDQGVSHMSLGFAKLDYVQFAYYSLQRRIFYICIVGLIFIAMRIRKYQYWLLFCFATLLLVELSFTQRNNNWYLVPSMPFWALATAYGVKKIIDLGSRFVNAKVVAVVVMIPVLFISYKTYTVNIRSVINSESSVAEVASARYINSHSKPNDVIMRLDFSYPVTIYYADRKVYATDKVDTSLFKTIQTNHITWIVGKKDIIDRAIAYKPVSIPSYERTEIGEESVLHLLPDNTNPSP